MNIHDFFLILTFTVNKSNINNIKVHGKNVFEILDINIIEKESEKSSN